MPQPDIVLVLTDNQAAGTLGCYGNSEVHTPNIDRLAREGILLRNAYSANGYCSPCRASILTGMIPSQHGVHAWIDDSMVQDWPPNWHALRGLPTLPELLQAQGYRTGIFGKYHLGDPTSPAPGWDNWVTLADGSVRSFYDNAICDNGTCYPQAGHAVDFFTEKALNFIATSEEPAFAYLPLPAPYGHWPATNDGRHNRHTDRYAGCPMASIPRQGLSVDALRSHTLNGAPDAELPMALQAPNDLPTLRNYYSQISMIDDAVGRIAEACSDALIVFCADHGMSLGQHGFWGHGSATFPSNLHRAAHSIPLIVRTPGGAARSEETHMVSNTDLFATILDFAGGTPDPHLPSRSFVGRLRGGEVLGWGPNEVFAEQEETRVIRTLDWTFFKRFNGPGAPELGHALYNVQDDPEERVNLIDVPEHAVIAERMAHRIDTWFSRHCRPVADLWTGGVPIQNSTRGDFWRGAWGEEWAPVYGY